MMLSIEFYSQGAYKATPLGPKLSRATKRRVTEHTRDSNNTPYAFPIDEFVVDPTMNDLTQGPPQEPTDYTMWSGSTSCNGILNVS